MSTSSKRKSLAAAIAAADPEGMRCEEPESVVDDVLAEHAAKKQKVEEAVVEEQKAIDTASLQPDWKSETRLVAASSSSIAHLSVQQRRDMLAELQAAELAVAAVDVPADLDDDDLDMGVKQPTTKEFMRAFFIDTKAKVAAMARGEEVNTCIYPDQAALLWSINQNQLIHFMEFRDVPKTLTVWKSAKTIANYANIEPRAGKQRFGARAVDFPHKLVVLGPVLKAQFTSMGEEGNFWKLGKDNGPETVEKVKYEMVLSGESYSKRVCNDQYANPVADCFFDWLEETVEWAVREHFKAGKYNVFKAHVEKKVSEANKKKVADAAKKKEQVDQDSLERAPQSDAEWLELLLSNHIAPVVKTDAKGIRNISVGVSALDKLKKDKNNNLIGLDADHVPRNTKNGLFTTMFYDRKALVNGEDQQRKEHVINYWRCMTAGEVQKGGDLSRAFPFAALKMHARNGDLFMPLVSLNFYDWSGKEQTGFTKGIWDLVYVGHDGELNDTHCGGCNPLEAIPMSTKYIEAPDAADDSGSGGGADALVHGAVGEIDPNDFQ